MGNDFEGVEIKLRGLDYYLKKLEDSLDYLIRIRNRNSEINAKTVNIKIKSIVAFAQVLSSYSKILEDAKYEKKIKQLIAQVEEANEL